MPLYNAEKCIRKTVPFALTENHWLTHYHDIHNSVHEKRNLRLPNCRLHHKLILFARFFINKLNYKLTELIDIILLNLLFWECDVTMYWVSIQHSILPWYNCIDVTYDILTILKQLRQPILMSLQSHSSSS